MNKHDRPMGSIERRIRKPRATCLPYSTPRLRNASRTRADGSASASAIARQRRAAAAPARRVAHGCGVGSVVRRTSRVPAAGGRSPRARVVGSRPHRRGRVREHAHRLIDGVLDALGLDDVPVVGHSLGAMFALWHAAAGSERISEVIVVGVPAVALPGVRVRMPLSLLTVCGLGVAVLRSPSPRPIYRRLLAQGFGSAEVKMAPDSLIEALRLSARRPESARTVASPMRGDRSLPTTEIRERLDRRRARRDPGAHDLHLGITRPLPLSSRRTSVDRPDPERDGPRNARRPWPMARRPWTGRGADRSPPRDCRRGRRSRRCEGCSVRPINLIDYLRRHHLRLLALVVCARRHLLRSSASPRMIRFTRTQQRHGRHWYSSRLVEENHRARGLAGATVC
jgi:pimeloyl-ACP methyl ester carboxylesterase